MIRPFFETLRELRAGQTLDELAAKLHDAVEAVRDLDKPAELVLRIRIKPFTSKGVAGAIVLEDEVEVKLPKPERDATLFFATPEGNLSRHNTRQDDLPGITVAAQNSNPQSSKGAA